ncbi:glutathione S-transferase [Aestuariibius insulae]|uniref:glutathione S-transferase n=1 Tax=Aestuariibius insulae TaxID=2058287 RepID=UPI00345F1577
MTYHLILGDRAYSSWSLRAWLLVDRWDIDADISYVSFLSRDVEAQLERATPSRTVPTLVLADGTPVWDSLAVAETLAEAHPSIWPEDAPARAVARSLAAEMHSGFGALREVCPMNLRVAYQDWDPGDGVAADLRRLERIWDYALDRFGGPWLCGEYSAADAFYTPVAARIAGYGLNVSESAAAYVRAHLEEPSFRAWRALALTEGPDLPWYARSYPQADWPG